MKRKRIHSLIIFLVTAVLVFLIVFVSVKIYRLALADTRRGFQNQQQVIALAASSAINICVQHLEEDLWLLAATPAVQLSEKDGIKSAVDNYFRHLGNGAVRYVLVADENADIVYFASEANAIPGWISSALRLRRPWIQNPENSGKCWYSSVNPIDEQQQDSEFCFLMIVPLVQKDRAAQARSTKAPAVGMVAYVVSFDWLMQRHIAPLRIGNTGFSWVMDASGRLLFHGSHPEMTLRTVKDPSPDCRTCHSSFAVQNRILDLGNGVGEYSVAGEPPKLMAFKAIDLLTERWLVVVSTQLPEVTAILRSKFRFFFIHMGVILALVIISSILLYKLNTQRIRADEERRRIEERGQLQEQMNHAAKLASIGELVDTVAHEVNTPAGIIAVQADALRLRLATSEAGAEELQIIKDQTRRIHNYTRSLLDYSRRMPFTPRPTKITTIMDQCVYLLGHRFRARGIELVKNYADNIPMPQVDKGQIEQVFLNLLNNATDALEAGGEISITIRPLAGQNSPAAVEILIADNGPGISAEVLPNIFKPFFSTKQPNKGTGLGLSISKAIIQRHRGRIQVFSEPGKGTALQIILPTAAVEEV